MAKQERDNALYDMLKWSHANLTKDLNFSEEGKSADEVYRKLKIRIIDEYYAALFNQGRLYKAMWISIVATIVYFFLGGWWLGEAFPPIFVVLVGLDIALGKWARGYDSKLQTYRDFDEDFFGGEIFYKLSRGIKL